MIILIKEFLYLIDGKTSFLKVFDPHKCKSLILIVITVSGPLIHLNRFQ